MNKNLYIIAGCNGAGKTTASFTILPEILNCKEFVNADEIAKGVNQRKYHLRQKESCSLGLMSS